MPRKTISYERTISYKYNKVDRSDEEKTDDKEEVEPQYSPTANKHWHDTNQRKVERLPFDAPIESHQVIDGFNECIFGVIFFLARPVKLRSVPSLPVAISSVEAL